MRRIRNVLVVPALLTLAAVPSVASSSSIVANPICAKETLTGTITGTRTVGPVCVPYSGAVDCTTTNVALDPTLGTSTYLCIPI